MKKLDQKVAVITGGNSGIGLATALLFAKHGAKVAIFGRNTETLQKAVDQIGPGTLAVAGDVSKIADLDRLYSKVRENLGRIDVLVAGAGIGYNRMLSDVTEEFFDQMMATNVKGAYFTVQRALPLFSAGASIVLVSSVAAQKGAPGAGIYGASKAAVRAMARSFSRELLPRNIRVNALSPGLTDTPAVTPQGLGLPAEAFKQFTQGLQQLVPMRRLGTAEESANAALFLASDDSSFMAGADLVVDGGFTSL